MSLLSSFFQRQISQMLNQPDPNAVDQSSPEYKTYQKLYDKAQNEGNVNQMLDMADDALNAGFPAHIYLNASGTQTPEQQTEQAFNQFIAEKLGLTQPKEPSPFDSTEIAIDAPAGQQTLTPSAKAQSALSEIFTPEFTARFIAKKTTGIDVGENALTDGDWFKEFTQLPANLSASEKKEILAAKYGYIPKEAAQLKDLSIEERKQITEGLIGKYLNDPDLDATVRQYFPNADPQKTKMGVILHRLTQEGYPIPERFVPFIDRFNSLSDDMIEFEASRKAREASATTRASTRARLETEFAMEAGRPISSADRTKYGIDSSIPTYQALADQGFRFPTEADRKIYQQLSSTRDQFKDLQEIMFGDNGVFKGIGKDWVDRKTAQAELMKERALGSARGRNYEVFADKLQTFARSLLVLAGESGGRFTDRDVEQMVKGWASLGGVVEPIDSEAIAQQKFEMSIMQLNRKLSQLTGDVVVRPTSKGQPKAATPTAQPKPGITPSELKALQANPKKILTNRKTGRSWKLDANGNPIEVTK